MWVPLFPHPCQHFLSVTLLISAILTNMRWNLKVVLVCASRIVKSNKHFLRHFLDIFTFSNRNSLQICAGWFLSTWNKPRHTYETGILIEKYVSIRLTVSNYVGHLLDWKLIWKSPIHCAHCCVVGPQNYKKAEWASPKGQASRQHSSSFDHLECISMHVLDTALISFLYICRSSFSSTISLLPSVFLLGSWSNIKCLAIICTYI